MKILYFDLETTTVDVNTTEVVQLAYKVVDFPNIKENDLTCNEIEIKSAFYNIEGKYSIGARAISNLEPDRTQPLFKDAKEIEEIKKWENEALWVAHNGKAFDFVILERYGINPRYKIDSFKVAKDMLESKKEDLEGKLTLGHIYYYLLDLGKVKPVEGKFHNALTDILVLEQIFLSFIKDYKEFLAFESYEKTLLKMVKIYNELILEKYFPFGKHQGTLFSEVPLSYLEWAIGKDLHEDTKYTTEYYINLHRNQTVQQIETQPFTYTVPQAIEKAVETFTAPNFSPPELPEGTESVESYSFT